MAQSQHFFAPEELALRIARNKPTIQLRWLSACKEKIASAKSETYTYLNDSLPEVLDRLIEVLKQYDDHHDFYEAMVLAKKHGEQRALSPHYTAKDLLTEYQLLREILMEFASANGNVGARTANILSGFIEASLAHAIDDFLKHSALALPQTAVETSIAPEITSRH